MVVSRSWVWVQMGRDHSAGALAVGLKKSGEKPDEEQEPSIVSQSLHAPTSLAFDSIDRTGHSSSTPHAPLFQQTGAATGSECAGAVSLLGDPLIRLIDRPKTEATSGVADESQTATTRGPRRSAPNMEDELLAEELQAQVAAAKQVVVQVRCARLGSGMDGWGGAWDRVGLVGLGSPSPPHVESLSAHNTQRTPPAHLSPSLSPSPSLRHSKPWQTQLEAEIRETMDGLELRTAAAEARRLRADRGTAKLQREQVRILCGRG